MVSSYVNNIRVHNGTICTSRKVEDQMLDIFELGSRGNSGVA